ncbi:MAG: ADP-ribosylglycohydrolase family protein, partial [Planctomycetes bacterium]|nr:ADP-ribosylglycohydrolase family protein [Planctomycetota bacterium]
MNIYNLMAGLAAGDALGATSEFQSLARVQETYSKYKSTGWPFTAIGGGAFGFKPGYPTDDAEMARAILDAWLSSVAASASGQAHFNGQRIAENFVTWMNGNPPDMGMATRATLSAVRDGEVWWKGGYAFWKSNRHAWSNGSLM